MDTYVERKVTDVDLFHKLLYVQVGIKQITHPVSLLGGRVNVLCSSHYELSSFSD